MIIYKALNKINKKIYIGQTIQKLNRRIIGHKHASKSGRVGKFNNALRKYGIDGFHWEVICECYSIDDLQIAESVFILYYDSVVSGYNSATGGKNFLHSEETKKLLSKQRSGRKLNDEWKKNVVNAIIENSNKKFPINENDVISRYKNSLSTEKVARELKTTRSRVSKILQKHNIQRTGAHKPRTEKQMLASSMSGKRKRTDEEIKRHSDRMRGNKYGLGHKLTDEQKMKMSIALKNRKISSESIEKRKKSSIRDDGKHFNIKRIDDIHDLIIDYETGLTRNELEIKYKMAFDTLLLRIKEYDQNLPTKIRNKRMSLCKKRVKDLLIQPS